MKKMCNTVNLLSVILFLAIFLPNIINVTCMSSSVLTMINNTNKGNADDSHYISAVIQDANMSYSYGEFIDGKPMATTQLYVLPTEVINLSGVKMATANGDSIIAMATRINALLPESKSQDNLMISLSLAQIIVFIMSIVLFVQFIIKVNQGDVFSWKNVRKLRWLGFLCLISFLIVVAQAFANAYYVEQIVKLKDYTISPYMCIGLSTSLIISVVCFFAAEIFAKGLVLKEEQDLTI